jgi:hypothetical protein
MLDIRDVFDIRTRFLCMRCQYIRKGFGPYSGALDKCFIEKMEGRKSRDAVPLIK